MCEALYKSMSQHTLIKSVYTLSHTTVEEPGHHHPAQACALGRHDSPTTVGSAEGSTSTHTCHACLRKHRCQLMSCCLSYEVHIKLAWIPAFSKIFVTSWWLTLLSSNFLILNWTFIFISQRVWLISPLVHSRSQSTAHPHRASVDSRF